MPELELTIEVRDSLSEIDKDDWNALCDDGNPFLSYEFLYSLECTGCLGQHNGWYPRYFLLWQTVQQTNSQKKPSTALAKKLVGAMPAYLKTNSYGEFVFDWAWAEAYERNNLSYYPKLVCSIPFTPCTGQRILTHPELERSKTIVMLANAARQFCHSEEYSSVHWLFVTETESNVLSAEIPHNNGKPAEPGKHTKGKSPENGNTPTSLDLLRRIDCQYHWRNDKYNSFDDFLKQCTAKRRKTIRRERRYVSDAGIRVERRMGSTLTDTEWQHVHELYQSTFDRKWGNPSLTLEFFKRIGSVFGGSVLTVLAYSDESALPEKPIACSIMFIGKTVLYGRYWGCREQHNSLHFEACYYQGIDFCIERGLTTFEPGAQGEHKITRGFIPTITRSAHYIAHPAFRDAIANFLIEETQHVQHRCEGLTYKLPFKEPTVLTPAKVMVETPDEN